ncbi:MAG: galactokinase [candidate division KSB1 bacterium]|nr:galactokinase [candidate division KSB1 bacterium]MDZ7367382.1 galactokinase [candidate division KSB1 bacterium]MDZ7405263.1 galactokinase [candidate division KSB1 bacterium]
MARYAHLVQEFQSRFAILRPRIFSTPGRTEIGGNHTDHNHGKVLAASINLDAIAAAAPVSDNRITIYSAGYSQPFIVKLNDLEPRTSDYSTTTALLRGLAARFQQLGFRVGGFHACISSEVRVGSGLSSSAAIEILLGTILNALYNDNAINLETLAAIGQFAENVYFNKPCGLMDQIACAVGGIVAIDFENPQQPLVEKIDFDFAKQNYSLIVVNTGGNHADLTDDYAAVPREMKAVAAQLGKQVCRQITRGEVLQNIHHLRATVGDRAILRALHFFEENERVDRQVAALRGNDFAAFLREVNASGNSSFRWLQNCFTTQNVAQQGVTLALALTENFLASIGEGACRVHGGGFAGTIQVFLPNRCVSRYTALMETVFKQRCVQVLNIRPVGTMQLG